MEQSKKSYRNTLKEKGLCIECTKPRNSTRSLSRCDSCLERSAIRQAKSYNKRIALGLCKLCGVEKESKQFLNCLKCRRKATEGVKDKYKFNLSSRLKRLLSDYKCFDKRKNLEFDLTYLSLEKLIENGCSYCGESTLLKIGADRVDNSKGHTLDNVVASCSTCNRMRMNLPYEAWLIVAEALKKARQLNLI